MKKLLAVLIVLCTMVGAGMANAQCSPQCHYGMLDSCPGGVLAPNKNQCIKCLPNGSWSMPYACSLTGKEPITTSKK